MDSFTALMCIALAFLLQVPNWALVSVVYHFASLRVRLDWRWFPGPPRRWFAGLEGSLEYCIFRHRKPNLEIACVC